MHRSGTGTGVQLSKRALTIAAGAFCFGLLLLSVPHPVSTPEGDGAHHVMSSPPPRPISNAKPTTAAPPVDDDAEDGQVEGKRDAALGDTEKHHSGGASTKGMVNGVILFLYGGRWHSYFVDHNLPRLHKNFLQCRPYPVHIFHEGVSNGVKKQVQGLLPASRVDFEDVSSIWKTLPDGVSESSLEHWMNDGVQKKFQGRGYRIMCRFWSGLAWMLPSMDKYDYYLRLDTDSILNAPLRIDPFRRLVDRGCEYGYNRLKGENPHVATKLYETVTKWGKETGVSAERMQALDKFATKNGKYWAPMFYNNFEMGSFKLKRSETYQSLFQYVDSKPPFGIFRYRWGDAPFHTLGVVLALSPDADSKMCNFTKDLVPYRHNAMKPGPINSNSCDIR